MTATPPAGLRDLSTPSRSAVRGTATLLPDPPTEDLWCPLISVDDHVLEPFTIFSDRLAPRDLEHAPFVAYDDEVPFWMIDGEPFSINILNGAAGRPIKEWTSAPARPDEFRAGVTDGRARLEDMDRCGIWAAVNFPSLVWGFTGWRFAKLRDRDAGLACVRAYNDWMLEWCDVDRDRLIPCQLSWLGDAEVAAAEVRANAARGFRAVSFSENPERLGFPSLYSGEWDPFFAACEETETVVNLHLGSSGFTQQPSLATPSDAVVALFQVNGMITVVDWIYSKIPVHFPGLKIVLSEAGVSWVPAMRERLRRAYRQVETSTAWTADDPDPVELLHRNFWFTSIEDPSAFRLLDLIGDEHVMLETDYPHPDTSWPHAQAMARGQLEALPTESIQRICYRNAADLYRSPAPPDAWWRASELGRSALA